VIKSLLEFPESKDTKSGYDYKCKQCHRDLWHARKPEAVADWHVIIGTFVPSQESFCELFVKGGDGILSWKVEFAPKARKGQVAGSLEGFRQRIIIQGQRYNGSDIIAMMETGEFPEKQECHRWLRIYEEEWMKDVKVERFPDWSYEWRKERMKRKANEDNNSPERLYERESMKQIRTHKSKSIYPDWSILWSRSMMSMSNQQRAKANLRTRLKRLMKTARMGGAKIKSSFIGCSTDHLSKHLESRFTKKMNWDNYGTYWHVDHVIPCAAFDHRNENQVKQCWHWTNLQPLEAKENIKKGDMITQPQMSLCM
jgi:hypothetical protein